MLLQVTCERVGNRLRERDRADAGVWWDENSRSDLFAFTLDKSAGSFSPTTRYRDYAISPELIHWESQSATALDSDTGRRYISQAQVRRARTLCSSLD